MVAACAGRDAEISCAEIPRRPSAFFVVGDPAGVVVAVVAVVAPGAVLVVFGALFLGVVVVAPFFVVVVTLGPTGMVP